MSVSVLPTAVRAVLGGRAQCTGSVHRLWEQSRAALWVIFRCAVGTYVLIPMSVTWGNVALRL